jgi:HEPN domain-containing protein
MLPPHTHNLVDLAQQGKLNLSQAQRDFIGKINNASIATRYPSDLTQLMAQYSATVVRDYLEQTQEIITWLRQDPRLQTS